MESTTYIYSNNKEQLRPASLCCTKGSTLLAPPSRNSMRYIQTTIILYYNLTNYTKMPSRVMSFRLRRQSSTIRIVGDFILQNIMSSCAETNMSKLNFILYRVIVIKYSITPIQSPQSTNRATINDWPCYALSFPPTKINHINTLLKKL